MASWRSAAIRDRWMPLAELNTAVALLRDPEGVSFALKPLINLQKLQTPTLNICHTPHVLKQFMKRTPG